LGGTISVGEPPAKLVDPYKQAHHPAQGWGISVIESGEYSVIPTTLADKSSKPESCPHQMSPVIEARVIELRRMHPGWGPRSLRTRLEHEGFSPVPGRYSSTHKTPEIHRWLLRHPRFTLHFTPTYSSWMNLVERWFAELTTKWLRRGTHRSTKELEAAITTWIANWNEDPKPFVWHKSADEILDTLAAYCARISDSGH